MSLIRDPETGLVTNPQVDRFFDAWMKAANAPGRTWATFLLAMLPKRGAK